MAYNVLHYGDGCQGTNAYLHSKLKTIVQYVNPDILGLVKMQAIKVNATDWNGVSPVGFADSIVAYALDAAYPGKYAYCALTNFSNDADGDMDVLFYNQNKLGFLSLINLCKIQEDFDLYKLYYKDPHLHTTHDTTFLYVILNHTISGSTTSGRDQQDSTVVQGLKNNFYHLPNLMSMGDFNTHTSAEPGYQVLTNQNDSSYLFYDPPFKPDHHLNYPLSWNSNASCAAYLNTATRQSSTVPNACGSNGGAKDWFIHILLSDWLVNNTDYIHYIPNSYTTLGNDGKRFSISVNDSVTNGKNLSAPANVLNALFDLSDKYPVVVKLGVTFNTTGTGPANPTNSISSLNQKDVITVYPNPGSGIFTIENNFSKRTWISIYDLKGELVLRQTIQETTNQLDATTLKEGIYYLSIFTETSLLTKKLVILK